MPIQPDHIEAIVFDYANTLVEFSHAQIDACDRRLAETLTAHFGAPDPERMRHIRARQRVAPYHGNPPDFAENNLVDISNELVRELYGEEPRREALNAILKTRFDAFVETIRVTPDVFDLLDVLREDYRLALISNYPCPHAIHESLKRIGLFRYFESIVISGEVGYIKPHPLPFRVVCEEMMLKPEQALFVGDNWRADIQGAKQAGMQAVWLTRWANPEGFEPAPGDAEPDAVIEHLDQLPSLWASPPA